jgi:hypothetical protein
MTDEFKTDEAWRERIKADKFGLHEFELIYFGAKHFGKQDSSTFPEFWDWLAASVGNMAKPEQTAEETLAWRRALIEG